MSEVKQWVHITLSSALVVFSLGSAITNAIFNNYLVDVFKFTADQRGWLEIPREFPGLLVTLTIGFCFFLTEIRLLSVACFVAALGMVGVAQWSPSLYSMVWWVFLWSMGTHVQMVLIERIAMDVGMAKGVGHRLGRMNGLRSLGIILGAGFVMAMGSSLQPDYSFLFLVAGGAMAAGGILYYLVGTVIGQRSCERSPFVLKRRYSRYYVLSVLFGIRKQIFITFAPWFLVKILGFRPDKIAYIFVVSAGVGMIAKPFLGKLIDRWGERTMLMLDGLLIAGCCLGYVIFPMVAKGVVLAVMTSACFILDDLLFTLRTARTTWLGKIAESPSDVTATMSVSVSLDHLISISISWFAGLVWIGLGYQAVFLFCVVVALAMTVISAGIKIPAHSSAH